MAARQSEGPAEVPTVAHRWEPIQDLPADWEALTSRELRGLSSVWEEQRESTTADEALRALRAAVVRCPPPSSRSFTPKRAEDRRGEWERAKQLADSLRDRASRRFNEIAQELYSQVAAVYPEFRAFADDDRNDPDRNHWFRFQSLDAARTLDYFATWRDYGSWVRLGLRDGSQADVVVVLTAIGHEYRGLVGATVTFSRREHAGEAERPLVKVETASNELFQLNYKDDEAELTERFDRWLDRSLVCALEMWRQALPG